MLDSLMQAADRGVRVRMLIDYITLNKSDKVWGVLNAYPNISLRLFNPLSTARQGWFLGPLSGLLMHLKHFSKRMHNKAFIADNQLSIIGGRNIGDAYFDNSQDFNFRDVDILAAGHITSEVSRSFDSFWNSREAYPISTLTTARFNGRIKKRFLKLKKQCREEAEKGNLPPAPDILSQLIANDPPLVWARAEFTADSPRRSMCQGNWCKVSPCRGLRSLPLERSRK